MIVKYHKVFEKHFKKRVFPNTKLLEKFNRRIKTFFENPNDSSLRNHRLIGDKNEYLSFSITGDIRVVYKVEGETIVLLDIGSHSQVY